MLKHSKWLMFTVVAVGLAVVAGGAIYAAHAQADMPMYVGQIQLGGFAYHGPTKTAASVQIVDQSGQPVSGAMVTGTFTGCGETRKSSDTTDGGGFAFILGRVRKCGCVYRFTVTNVTKNGWTWVRPEPLPSASHSFSGCQ
jgi:hypothetical protein